MPFSPLVILLSTYVTWSMWNYAAPGASLWTTIVATVIILLVVSWSIAVDEQMWYRTRKLVRRPSTVVARLRDGYEAGRRRAERDRNEH
jgi:hypothetical protein